MSDTTLIKKGVPIPDRSKWSWFVKTMEPGDCIELTVAEASSFRTQARLHGKVVVSRTLGPNKVGVWMQ